MKGWLKGGLVGGSVGLLYFFLYLIISYSQFLIISYSSQNTAQSIGLLIAPLVMILLLLCSWEGGLLENCNNYLPLILIAVACVVIFFIVGSILGFFIGWIVGKIKSKNQGKLR